MSADSAKLLVLVVEDEPLIGMVIEDVVDELGHSLLGPATELGEALNIASSALIECAILDINIRGGESYPVAFALLDRCVPILLVTGHGAHTLPARLRGEDCLSKPFTTDQLESALRKLFERALRQQPIEQG